jgi:hypothetical protein
MLLVLKVYLPTELVQPQVQVISMVSAYLSDTLVVILCFISFPFFSACLADRNTVAQYQEKKCSICKDLFTTVL